jgi:hypothetical protein
VDDQHRHARAYLGEFQSAEGRLYRLAAANEECARGFHFKRIDSIDASGGNDEDCENDEKDSARQGIS